MHPTLFRAGRFAVATHDFFVLLGVIVAAALFVLDARRRGRMNEQLGWVVMGALLLGGIAAKASTAWRYVSATDGASIGALWVQGGKSVVGGLAGAYFGAVIAKKITGYRERTGDMFAPAVAAGIAVGRIGCFLTEQIGTATALPWGMTVSVEQAARIPSCPACATGAAMHPSFLYEIAFMTALFGFLLWLRPRVRVPGELFKVFLLSYGIFRFAVEFVRGNPADWWGLTGSQLFLAFTIPVLLAYFVRQVTRDAYARPVPGAVVPEEVRV